MKLIEGFSVNFECRLRVSPKNEHNRGTLRIVKEGIFRIPEIGVHRKGNTVLHQYDSEVVT